MSDPTTHHTVIPGEDRQARDHIGIDLHKKEVVFCPSEHVGERACTQTYAPTVWCCTFECGLRPPNLFRVDVRKGAPPPFEFG